MEILQPASNATQPQEASCYIELESLGNNSLLVATERC